MRPSATLTALRLASSIVGCALAIGNPSVALAGLLDQPPKVVTLKLDDPAAPTLPLLRAFRNAEVERPNPMRLYLGGRWGRWGTEARWLLTWRGVGTEPSTPPVTDESLLGDAWLQSPGTLSASEVDSFDKSDPRSAAVRLAGAISPAWLARIGEQPISPAFAWAGPTFSSNGFDALWATPPKTVPWWERCRRRPVTFVRYGAERASFQLVGCDGAVAPGTLDQLAIVARPPEVASPGAALPDEPDADAWQSGEWIPGIKLVHPRLAWLLQRIADAFPWRTVYVFSGYRPKNSPSSRTHHSMHGEGRAMDISVMGVPNASLFLFCRTLDDAGCGFYPNSKFVHVDVRRPGTGRAFWIDVSEPGEPSRFVDSWPGVVDSGGLAWDASASPYDR